MVLTKLHELVIKILVNLDIIQIFHNLFLIQVMKPKLLLVLFELDGSVDGAPFEVKHHFLVVLILKMACILHDNNVDWGEPVCLNCKYAIYSHEQ